MKIVKYGVDRRTVIEAYVRYDCDKNNRAVPDFSAWDWSGAGSIDEATQAVAIGYLGRRPDPESLFMQAKFPELLPSV